MILKNNVITLLLSIIFSFFALTITAAVVSLVFRVVMIFKENIPFAFSLHDFLDAVEFGAVFGSAFGIIIWFLTKLHQHKPNWF